MSPPAFIVTRDGHWDCDGDKPIKHPHNHRIKLMWDVRKNEDPFQCHHEFSKLRYILHVMVVERASDFIEEFTSTDQNIVSDSEVENGDRDEDEECNAPSFYTHVIPRSEIDCRGDLLSRIRRRRRGKQTHV